MKTTINYNPTWDNDGYYITQNITLECTETELAYINSRVRAYIQRETNDFWLYTKLHGGLQRIGLTMLRGLKDTIGRENKRMKDDRNTFLDVRITKSKPRNTEGECVSCSHTAIDMSHCTLHNIPIYQDSMGCTEWEKARC